MKILVLNGSGNVGKSFITRELLFTKCNNSKGKILEIETHNSSSKKFKNLKNIEKMDGNEIEKLFENLLIEDDLVVDVGASNLLNFFTALAKNDSEMILEEIDYFIVPTSNESKQQNDTLKTILQLKEFNVLDKTKVILNKFTTKEEFDKLVKDLVNLGVDVDTRLKIEKFDKLAEIEELELTAVELANNDKDYKALAKESFKNKDMQKGKSYANLALLKGAAKAINTNLDNVCNLLKKQNNNTTK